MIKYLVPVFFATLLLFSFSCRVGDYQSSSRPVSHSIWDSLLHQNVTENGQVNYRGIIADSSRFKAYLNLLSTNHPNEKNWSREEQMAYWINAYNAYTVKMIVDHYPVLSIKDIKNGIPFVNTVWDIKFIQIEDASYDLNNIEHGILRPKYAEPRIHFAVNCASVSCPRLRNEAFTADKLEEQLTDQARYFLSNPGKNKISEAGNAELSKIFSWFKGDFTKSGTLIEFINQYSEVKLDPKANLSYLDYDWTLNE